MDTPNLLCGTHVRLTAVENDDAPHIARWYEDTAFTRLQDSNAAIPKNAAQISRELEQMAQASNSLNFAIRLTSDDSLIGTIGFYEIEWSNQVAWLGVGIGERDQWGKGYGTEALGLLLRFGFDELNLHRVSLTVLEYNQRAIALYERAGFQREGTFRQFGLRDGQRYDMYLYGLLRSEWQTKVGSNI